jgi:poly-gamma-glutamate system protein
MNLGAMARPKARGRVHPVWIGMAAAIALLVWLAVELAGSGLTHPRYPEMLQAARAVQAAQTVMWNDKVALGLAQGPDFDPNQTGMIGSEYTELTSTLGDLPSKRTTTNPDFAAAMVRIISRLHLPAGTPVVVIISGSFVGGDIATIAALEALQLEPILLSSLTASMFGANDVGYNLLDIFEALHERQVIRTAPIAAVLGADGAVGGGIDAAALAELEADAARTGVPIVVAEPLSALIDLLMRRIDAALDGGRPGLVINVGGASIGLGSCEESYAFPVGLTEQQIPCTNGTPGVAMRLAEQGLPVLNVLEIRRLALEMGLPFDPVPLPGPGNNRAVYGPE